MRGNNPVTSCRVGPFLASARCMTVAVHSCRTRRANKEDETIRTFNKRTDTTTISTAYGSERTFHRERVARVENHEPRIYRVRARSTDETTVISENSREPCSRRRIFFRFIQAGRRSRIC